MTNAMIILLEQVKLHEAGVLNATGKMLEMIDGTEIPEIEPIHTYFHWKNLGYQVKRGEHAVAKFPVWKYTKGKKKDMSEEEAQAKGFCFMKMSSFFSERQVEPIKTK